MFLKSDFFSLFGCCGSFLCITWLGGCFLGFVFGLGGLVFVWLWLWLTCFVDGTIRVVCIAFAGEGLFHLLRIVYRK
jgi:hypothetical protein